MQTAGRAIAAGGNGGWKRKEFWPLENFLRYSAALYLGIGVGVLAATFTLLANRCGGMAKSDVVFSGFSLCSGALFHHAAWSVFKLRKKTRYSVTAATLILVLGTIPLNGMVPLVLAALGVVAMTNIYSEDVEYLRTGEFRQLAAKSPQFDTLSGRIMCRLFVLFASGVAFLSYIIMAVVWMRLIRNAF